MLNITVRPAGPTAARVLSEPSVPRCVWPGATHLNEDSGQTGPQHRPFLLDQRLTPGRDLPG